MTDTNRRIFSVACFVVFGLLGLGSVNSDVNAPRVQSMPAAFDMSADQLYAEYNANEVAADSRYKGRVGMITGRIQNIGKDITGSAYVVLGGRGFLDGVQCFFPKSGEGSVARLSKGQEVKVKCEIQGKFGHVLAKNCTLL